MATTSSPIQKEAAIPFWRDVRVLGIFGQVIFMSLVVGGLAWLISNFVRNAEAQGLRLGFEFLNTTAGFDIAEGIEYNAQDTFGRALWVGIVNTIRVSFFGIILTTLLGLITGIARLSNNWLVSKIAEVYIELIRNIPLLVFLFFIHFGVTLKLPPVNNSIRPLDWPIFLNQRGVALPGLTPTTGFPIWLAFIVLGIILVMVLWTIQSRQEEQTGNPINKLGTAIWAFLIVAAAGWFVTSAFITDQAIMVASARNITSFDDFEPLYMVKVDKNALAELGLDRPTLDRLNSSEAMGEYVNQLNARLREDELTPEEVENIRAQLDILTGPAITLCSVSDTPSEINAASELRRRGIPVRISSQNSMSRAGAAYAAGDCDLLAGNQAALASERAILEDPAAHQLVPVKVTPLISNIPAPAGFNIQGGLKLSPEFASILVGLFIYHGAFAAELVRAGILSVSKGQTEAARALG